jgi:hypothetical protein
MNKEVHRPHPSWRASAAVGVLLVEVWQSSRLAQLCYALDHTRTALTQAQARLEFVHAQLDRQTTRAELAPLASQLGLVPADAKQVVHLPSEFLADAGETRTTDDPGSVLAWAERASRALVPEATARSRETRN